MDENIYRAMEGFQKLLERIEAMEAREGNREIRLSTLEAASRAQALAPGMERAGVPELTKDDVWQLADTVHAWRDPDEECERWARKLNLRIRSRALAPGMVAVSAEERSTGVRLIAEERLRQVTKEGWTPEHDADHDKEELALAAVCYAIPQSQRDHRRDGDPPYWFWPEGWTEGYWRPTPNDRIRELTKAGALIAAEIDRLDAIRAKREGEVG